MDFKIKFKEIFPRSIASVESFLGGHPKKYWVGLIIISLIGLCAIAVFDLYFFLDINNSVSAPLDVGSKIQTKIVNKAVLDKAAEQLLEKENRFQGALEAQMPDDPSL